MKQILIIVLLLLGIISTQAQTLKTLGNTEVYTLTSTTTYVRAIPVTFTEVGEIKSIAIYHKSGTGNMLLGIYSDVNGSPISRFGITASTLVAAVTGWQTVPLITPVTVMEGQTVWLAWVFQNSVVVRHSSGTLKRATSTVNKWAAGLPDLYGKFGTANFSFSVYCNYSTDITNVNQADKTEYAKYMEYCLTPAPRTFYMHGAVNLIKVNGQYTDSIGNWIADWPLVIEWYPFFSKSDTFDRKQQIVAHVDIMVPMRYPPSIYDFYKWWKTGFIQEGYTDEKSIPVYDFTR